MGTVTIETFKSPKNIAQSSATNPNAYSFIEEVEQIAQQMIARVQIVRAALPDSIKEAHDILDRVFDEIRVCDPRELIAQSTLELTILRDIRSSLH